MSTKIKIGAYNVNNLFDRFDDPYNWRDDLWRPRSTKPKNLVELFNMGQRILKDDPDVIALEEIENKGALKEFNVAHLGSLFPNIVLIEANDPRSIDVAVASKLPIGRVTSYQFRKHPDSKGKIFSRDLLEVEILKESGDDIFFTLFVTHLKSKFVDPSLKGEKREAQIMKDNLRRKRQAETIAEIIQERFDDPKTAHYLVAGDFNDTPESDPLKPLLDDNSLDLFNVVELLPENKRWTHSWTPKGKPREKSQIDYLLLSPPLRAKLVKKSVKIVHRGYSTGSDHKPLYAQIKYP